MRTTDKLNLRQHINEPPDMREIEPRIHRSDSAPEGTPRESGVQL